MIETRALVLEADERTAQIRTQRQSACGGCSSNTGCGVNTVLKTFDKAMVFKVDNSLGVRSGEHVVIGVQEHALVKASLIAYAFPLLAGIGGALAAAALAAPGSRDGYALFGILVGLAAGFAGARFLASTRKGQGDFQPVLLRREYNENFIPLVERR